MTDLVKSMEILNKHWPTKSVGELLEPDAMERLKELIVVCPVTPVGVAWIRMKELTDAGE